MKKKLFFPILLILCGIGVGVLITGVIYALTGFDFIDNGKRRTVSIDDAESADMIMLAYRVLEYIKDDDFNGLSHVVHPVYGVVLSPYATINLATDRRFSAEQIAGLGSDSSIYVWGVYNGSGEPIELTPTEYFDEFISAEDFLKVNIIGINQVVRSGNALENIPDVFPNAEFVDFHITAGEPTDDFDWRSLRLGFEEYNGYFRLIAIVFNKRTA